MPFPLRSMEQIYSDVSAQGHNAGFIVVAEFKLPFRDDTGKMHSKEVDIVWLRTGENAIEDHIPPYQVVAAFEVEGFDVALNTIRLHSTAYEQARQFAALDFPCYVPLYSLATHRADYGHDVDAVHRLTLARQTLAVQRHNIVNVCDGMTRDWLQAARKRADELRRLP